MHKNLYFLVLLPLFGCAAEDLEADPSGSDAGVIEADAGTEADSGAEVPVPDWVDPEVPEGPDTRH